MYTKHKSLGKFQGNESEMLTKAVYNASLDGCCESLGESEGFGYYAYVSGKRYDFILNENSQGFVYVEWGKPQEMIEKWERLEKDYAEWVGEGEEGQDHGQPHRLEIGIDPTGTVDEARGGGLLCG